jgi:hypothetical protein
MTTKLNYQTLTAVISNGTLKLVFQPELDFLTTHRWLFLKNQPDILFALNGNNLTISQLLAIREMRAQIEKQEEQERQTQVNPASLSGSHRSY